MNVTEKKDAGKSGHPILPRTTILMDYIWNHLFPLDSGHQCVQTWPPNQLKTQRNWLRPEWKSLGMNKRVSTILAGSIQANFSSQWTLKHSHLLERLLHQIRSNHRLFQTTPKLSMYPRSYMCCRTWPTTIGSPWQIRIRIRVGSTSHARFEETLKIELEAAVSKKKSPFF